MASDVGEQIKKFGLVLAFVVICGYGIGMETNPTTTKPDTQKLYAEYRAQGFNQKEANAKAIQDVINWGIANGFLQSNWGSK